MHGMNTPPLDPQQVQYMLHDPNLPAWKKYALLTTGTIRLAPLLRYEILTSLLGAMPGALGLALRARAYRHLLASMGRGSHIGRNVTLRGVKNIRLGKQVHIDDHCVIDARGSGTITIGDHVLISRNTIIRCRGENITIGEHSDIGANCIISTDSTLSIGHHALIAAYVYVCAGGNHRFDRCDIPILQQGFIKKGGVTIGDDVWIGAHSSIFDGVTIGSSTVIGAHSMVNRSLPARHVCFGSPAKPSRARDESLNP